MTTSIAAPDSLRRIFPDGAVFAVADDAELGRVAARLGLGYVPLYAADELPPGANVVLLLQHHMISKRLRLLFRHQSVLVVPIASFDGSRDAARYTLEMTLRTDYRAAAETATYWIGKLREGAGSIVFGSREPAAATAADATAADAMRLECSLGADLAVDAWPHAAIGPGDWVSVGSCCELALTRQPNRPDEDVFTLDGTARAAGVLAAHDPRCTEGGRERHAAAQRLRAELAESGVIRLSLRDNRLTSVVAGGRDFTAELLEVTNPEHRLQALELGIGTNLDVLPDVDWRFNSQLNEGAGAMHIGFGDGITGAHMDFVVPRCDHHFL